MFALDVGADDGCPLAGARVALDGSKPALRPCRYCEGDVGVLTGPSGPHHAGVSCASCLRHLGWLPHPDEDISLVE